MKTFISNIRWLLVCFVMCACTITCLYYRYDARARMPNGFSRTIRHNTFAPLAIFHSKFGGYYLAGLTSSRLYFANFNAPLHLIAANYLLTDTQTTTLLVKSTSPYLWKFLRVAIDSPFLYLMEGVTPNVFAGFLGKYELTSHAFSKTNFEELIPISRYSSVVKIYDSVMHQSVLAKLHNGVRQQGLPWILEKQIDGKFCTDGMLLYNSNVSKIIYLYYYRNQFMVADTNLSLELTAHTIDTTTTAKIVVAHLKNENTNMMSAPRFLVNKKSCMDEQYLYVQSNLAADNENRKTFHTRSIVDVYALVNGKYNHSFYLPNLYNQRPDQFYIVQHQLLCIYPNWIAIFRKDP